MGKWVFVVTKWWNAREGGVTRSGKPYHAPEYCYVHKVFATFQEAQYYIATRRPPKFSDGYPQLQYVCNRMKLHGNMPAPPGAGAEDGVV